MKKFFLLGLFLSTFNCLMADEQENMVPKDSSYLLTNEYAWISLGHHHTYDNYLSNLLYQGADIGAGVEQIKLYSASFPRISRFTASEYHFASDQNPAENYNIVCTSLIGDYGAHFHFHPCQNLLLMAGSYTNIDLGLKYLSHNGNNPVNVIGDANQWLSLMAYYHIKTKRRVITFRDHISTAFCGLMFSPKYTQLYYDIAYIDDYDGNFVVTSFGNCFRLRNLFSVDVPMGKVATVRFGMLTDRLKYKVNGLEGRNLNVAFQIGIVKNIYTFKGKESIPDSFINPLQ